MPDTVISVEHLSKAYRLGQIGTGRLVDDLQVWWAKARGKPNPLLRIGQQDRGNRDGETIWALQDLSFEVKLGEVLGIIGRNGAGKSTLLKIITGVTAPTSGQVKAKGRVASLLEVGTGFHPELTGRENIYLNGAILGMEKAEINRKFDEIVAFSEVEQFIDTPVKRYSSGMYVRLAFAVAAHLRAEILLIDEVLAVGDLNFQRKCLARMNAAAKSEFRTVLLVSHNMQAISTLASRCLLIQNGRGVALGPTADVIRAYLDEGASDSDAVFVRTTPLSRPGVKRVALKTSLPNNVQSNGGEMTVEFRLFAPRPVQSARLSFQIMDAFRRPVVYAWYFGKDEKAFDLPSGTHEVVCRMPALRLYKGRYSLAVSFSEKHGLAKLDRLEDICPFEVVMFGRDHEGGWWPDVCAYIEDHEWHVESALAGNPQ